MHAVRCLPELRWIEVGWPENLSGGLLARKRLRVDPICASLLGGLWLGCLVGLSGRLALVVRVQTCLRTGLETNLGD